MSNLFFDILVEVSPQRSSLLSPPLHFVIVCMVVIVASQCRVLQQALKGVGIEFPSTARSKRLDLVLRQLLHYGLELYKLSKPLPPRLQDIHPHLPKEIIYERHKVQATTH